MTFNIHSTFKATSSRNVILRNNILLSAVIKVVGLMTSLLIVPTTLKYLDKELYGIWMTISSILIWFSYFDIGMGNGMRNYLAESISKRDYEKARVYLTTTIFMLSIIAILLVIVSVITILSLNLNHFFNTIAVNEQQLSRALAVAVIFTLILFIVKNIGLVYVAMQKYAINDLLIVTGNILALILVFIITKTTKTNLLYIVLTFSVPPVVVFILAAIHLFAKHPELRPTRNSININFGKQILNKGLGFFFIQITSCLVIFGSSNIFITQGIGPEAVTTYNIAYKYFNLLSIGYFVVISPMWNAYTDAFIKNEYTWIKQTFKRSLAIWGAFVLTGIIMLVIAPTFYRLWVGQSVTVPFTVSCCVLIYVSFFNLNSGVTALINGVNKIHIQIITSIIFTALYVIATLLWGKKHGIEGIVICMAASYAFMSFIHLYQCSLIIRQKALGIWNK